MGYKRADMVLLTGVSLESVWALISDGWLHVVERGLGPKSDVPTSYSSAAVSVVRWLDGELGID